MELDDGAVRTTVQPAEKQPRRKTSAPAVQRPPVQGEGQVPSVEEPPR